MGFFGDLLKDAASAVGELGRMERTERKEEASLTDAQRKHVDAIIERAEIGDVDAMVQLAQAYYEGTFLRYDPKEACRWWTKAAEAGDVGSMYNLGILYCGDLSKMFYNDDQAAYWLNEAARRGDQEAWDTLNERFKYSHFRGKWVRI